MRDNREDLYDVNGNYVGQGGQGMVTQPGADPSDGGHAQVVKAGVEKLEDDVASAQNGVVQVKGALPGWSRGNGGRSPLSGVIDVANKVAGVAQASGNAAADAVKSPAPKAQVTQPASAGAGKELATVAQQPSVPEPASAVTPEVGSTAKSPALKELREKQKAEIDAENAAKPVMSAAEKEAESKDVAASREKKLQGVSFTDPDGSEFVFDRMNGDKAVFKDSDGISRELSLDEFSLGSGANAKRATLKGFTADTAVRKNTSTDGGHQPTVTEPQLQTEKNANPQSSETGNSRDGVTAQNTDAAGPADPKFTTGGSAAMNTVSDEDYTSAQQRIADAKKSGKIPEQQDEETVWLHDNPRPVQPEMPALETFTESQPPKLKDIDESYRTAYAIMAERIKAAGDDPASKAKRAKARRAQVLVAALGDLLQAAANMWGAAGGATSAKLSSVTAGVGRRHATEDAAELKREAQRAKDLEQMVRRGEKLTAAENKKIMELWKAGEAARKYNISEKNKAILAEYGKRNEAWGKDYASWLRRFEKIGKDNASARREANTFARQKAMEDYRQRNREKNQATSHRNAIALKGTPSYSDLHKSDTQVE